MWDVSGDVKNSLDQPQLTLLNVFHASLVRTVIINTAAVSVLLSVLEPIFLQPFLAQVRLSLGGSWGGGSGGVGGARRRGSVGRSDVGRSRKLTPA